MINSKNGLSGLFENLKDTQSAMVCPMTHSESLFEFTNQPFDTIYTDSGPKDYKVWINVVGYHKSTKGEFLRV